MIEFISRRVFLRRSGVGLSTLAAARSITSAAPPIPKRRLGKTGIDVSLLAFGGGSQFLLAKDGEWEPMLERAVASGINLFDTSCGYQWKSSTTSEDRFGAILPRYRKSVYVSTKFESRDPEKARKEFERSLQRLKMDYVDFLLIHSIEQSEDISALAKGVYGMMTKLKEEKLTRFIGISSMNSAAKSKELIQTLDVDIAILALSPTKYGDFAKVALPVAREKGVGVVAMKLMRDVVGAAAKPAEVLQYGWTQTGVAAVVVGHTKVDLLEQNLRYAQSFTPAQARAFDRQKLEMRLSHLRGPHALCWARPGYRDGAQV